MGGVSLVPKKKVDYGKMAWKGNRELKLGQPPSPLPPPFACVARPTTPFSLTSPMHGLEGRISHGLNPEPGIAVGMHWLNDGMS